MYLRDSDNRKRRWAKGMNRVQSGIWGKDMMLFRSITLTTVGGQDNTWVRMSKDVKLLIKRIRDRGVVVEYVLSPELSPGKGLLHVHGLLRFDKGEISLVDLGVLWEDIHGAVQVDLKRVHKFEALTKYIVKHMLKDYPEAIGFKGRLLISRGWMPAGWQVARKFLVRWALERLGGFMPVWPIMNEMYRRWCAGESVMINVQRVWVVVHGEKVTQLKKGAL
jgi:hypothetical protein